MQLKASWRSGYAEDCKSLYGGSIPSEASTTRRHALALRTLGIAPGVFSRIPPVGAAGGRPEA